VSTGTRGWVKHDGKSSGTTGNITVRILAAAVPAGETQTP